MTTQENWAYGLAPLIIGLLVWGAADLMATVAQVLCAT